MHNEQTIIENNLKILVDYFSKRNWDFELILAEDNSVDKTVSIVRRMCHSDRRIKLISVDAKIGKGGAILAAALNFPLKEYMAYMDIDLSAYPSELEKLLANIENYDIVIGSRLIDRNLISVKRPFYRGFLSHMYSRLFRLLFRIPIYDPQCGLKLFRSNKIKVLFEEITIPDFAFDTDLIISAFRLKLKIKEVPINWKHWGIGSKVRIVREINAMMLDLFSIWYKTHKLWRSGKYTDTKKRESILEKLFFVILSHSNKIKQRNIEHMDRIAIVKFNSEEIKFSIN